jgi:CBS domain-containing protein
MSMDQTVLEAKRIGVYDCSIRCTLNEAAGRMLDEDISALVAVDDEGCLAGIITRVDLLRAWQESPDWRFDAVQQYMNPDVVSVTEEVCLDEVARILLEKHIHRVVVVRPTNEGKPRPIAVVSAADLIYHMASEN